MGRLIFLVVAFGLAVPAARSADTSPDRRRGWQELSLLNAGEAQQRFAAAALADPASREARLGLALALLQLRSRTPGNIAAAGQLLETLRAESAGDDAGIAAAYYLARIQQLHGFTPDRAAATTGYRALLAA